MELLVALGWIGFLAYLANTKEGTIKLHLVIVWGLMLLSSGFIFVKLLFGWLRS
jgi:hypothetical protein